MYAHLTNLQLAWNERRARLADDRGEGMVSNTVIMVGVAALAVALLGLAGAYLAGWLNIWTAPANPTIP